MQYDIDDFAHMIAFALDAIGNARDATIQYMISEGWDEGDSFYLDDQLVEPAKVRELVTARVKAILAEPDPPEMRRSDTTSFMH